MPLNLERPRHESKLGRPKSPRDIRRRRVAAGMRSQGGRPDVHKWVQNPDVGSYIDEVKLQESREDKNLADFVSTFSISTSDFEEAMRKAAELTAAHTAEIRKFSLTNRELSRVEKFSIRPTDTPFWTSVTSGDTGDSIEIVTSSSTLPEHE